MLLAAKRAAFTTPKYHVCANTLFRLFFFVMILCCEYYFFTMVKTVVSESQRPCLN